MARLVLAVLACSLVLAPSAGAVTITEFPLPTADSGPYWIAAGPDGALWFTEFDANKVGRITTTGVLTEFDIPTASSAPEGIAAGPDGALWFAESGANQIAQITTAGVVTEYAIPTDSSSPVGIAAGPDGALWFTESAADKIGRITTAGSIQEHPIDPGDGPWAITAGPDGALWFTTLLGPVVQRMTTGGDHTGHGQPLTGNAFPNTIASAFGKLWVTIDDEPGKGGIATVDAATGTFEGFAVSGLSFPSGAALGPDGAMWFTHEGKIGRLSAGVYTEYPAPSSFTGPSKIAAGPDGALWFTEFTGNRVGRVVITDSPGGTQSPSPAQDGGGSAPKTTGTPLVAALGRNRYRVRRGRRLRLRFSCTQPARVSVEVLRRRKLVLRRQFRARRGRNVLTLPPIRRKGRYRLRIRARAGSQTSTDTASLTVTR